MASLPAEVLFLITAELAVLRDFDTLFRCSLSGKALAENAIPALYHIHNDFLHFISSDGTDAQWRKTQDICNPIGSGVGRHAVLRWALSWRSIIESSIGSTLYPYALYIRSLDLTNLSYLLEEPIFGRHCAGAFFTEEISQLLHMTTRATRATAWRFRNLNPDMAIHTIGDAIVTAIGRASKATRTNVALSNLLGRIETDCLTRWLALTTQLVSLTIWDGAQVDDRLAAIITNHCPLFSDLSFYTCIGDANVIDVRLAAFLQGLPQNSLRSFSSHRSHGLGQHSLGALNHHSASLSSLKLDGMTETALLSLSKLHDCTNLEVLLLGDNDGFLDLEADQNVVFSEILQWLSACHRLKDLSVKSLYNTTQMVAHTCCQEQIRLKRLEVMDYDMMLELAGGMHAALAIQGELESLVLEAYSEEDSPLVRADVEDLVSVLSQLPRLRELLLIGTSDGFTTEDISRLVSHLPQLEKFSMSGMQVDDGVWPSIAALTHLKDLNINATSAFTCAGLLDFIEMLTPTNQGLQLSVMYQDPGSPITDEQRLVVQASIASKVGGRFDLQYIRDTEEVEQSDFSSD